MDPLASQILERARQTARNEIAGRKWDDETKETFVETYAAGYMRCWTEIMERALSDMESREGKGKAG